MTELRNRVVQISGFGSPDLLEVVDASLPTAGRGEVRVRVLASAVEYTDVLIRRHLYPQTSLRRPPFVMGYDVVGEIDQVGDGVCGFQVGDRVADMTVTGSNATYRTLRMDRLTRVPADLDEAEATTHRSIDRAQPRNCGIFLRPAVNCGQSQENVEWMLRLVSAARR